MSGTEPHDSFKELGDEIHKRLRSPARNASYWFYLIIGVIFFGGIGIFIELYRYISSDYSDLSSIRVALSTYALAIVGSSGIQIVFDEASKKAFRGAALLAIIIMTSLLFIESLLPRFNDLLLVFNALIGICVWWIANANNPVLMDQPPSNAATGGDPEERELAGAIDVEFKV